MIKDKDDEDIVGSFGKQIFIEISSSYAIRGICWAMMCKILKGVKKILYCN
jgi:hypothetical protein